MSPYRIIPKHFDGTDYHFTNWHDPETNIWSVEKQDDKGLWGVVGDFYDKAAAQAFVDSFDSEEARAGARAMPRAEPEPAFSRVATGSHPSGRKYDIRAPDDCSQEELQHGEVWSMTLADRDGHIEAFVTGMEFGDAYWKAIHYLNKGEP